MTAKLVMRLFGSDLIMNADGTQLAETDGGCHCCKRCNDCSPKLNMTYYATFTGLTGVLAGFTGPCMVNCINWPIGCIWTGSVVYGGTTITVTLTGSMAGWTMQLSESGGCIIQYTGPIPACTPTGSYNYAFASCGTDQSGSHANVT
jgi:hypothetical protein